jgi:ubiquinone/menaquinone biosynthesis C-methylase UbiE
VNVYFQAQSSYWKEIYARSSVYGEIYRTRQSVVLAWIDGLALAPGSRVLEVGCGAGFLSVALAQRGLQVQAVDSAEAMVELARQHAQEAEVSELLSVDVGDANMLAFAEDSFDLVVAIGVTSWLAQPELAIREMARVAKPGGYVILTDGNQSALHFLLDPSMNPLLKPFRRGVKSMLERIGLLHPAPKPLMAAVHPCRFIDEALRDAELMKTRGVTVGFGPFTFLSRKILPESLGIVLHRRLQRLADRTVPIFRSTGMSYLVLARKPAPRSLRQATDPKEPVTNATTEL